MALVYWFIMPMLLFRTVETASLSRRLALESKGKEDTTYIMLIQLAPNDIKETLNLMEVNIYMGLETNLYSLKYDMLDDCVDLFIDTFSKKPWNDIYESRKQVVDRCFAYSWNPIKA